MDLPAVLRPVSRASKYALASSRVAMGALFGSSGGAKGAGGVTLRAAVIASAVFLAAGIAGSVSLSDGSEARPATYPAASENPEDLGGVEDRVLNESPKDP
jgi:hypothetical protein